MGLRLRECLSKAAEGFANDGQDAGISNEVEVSGLYFIFRMSFSDFCLTANGD